jgi:hypothetical protein
MSAHQTLPQFIHGQPSIGLPFEKELVVNLFAGGGGASTGIARAYREPDGGKPQSNRLGRAPLQPPKNSALRRGRV